MTRQRTLDWLRSHVDKCGAVMARCSREGVDTGLMGGWSTPADRREAAKMDNGEVTFRYKDYRQGNAERTMTLSARDFIRRFLQHVLPTGFQRIRYYGFLGNRHRGENLALCRELLHAPAVPAAPESAPDHEASEPRPCPACHVGHLVRLMVLPGAMSPPTRMDSS